MLPSLLFVAPCLLLSTACALPKSGAVPKENAHVQCQGAAVASTSTTASSTSSSTSSLGGKGAAASTSTSSSSSASAAPSLPSVPANATAVPSNATANVVPSGYHNALYFTNWGIYGANFQPQQLPANQVTHVLYAFADINPDGEVVSSDSWSDYQKHYPGDSWNDQGQNAYGCVKQLYILKKQHRQMKILLSIGGWTYSPKFAPVAATEAGRQKFCNSSVALMKDWGFDGLDIDWEYPADATQAQNFVQLLQTCRTTLDTYAAQHTPGYHFLLTVAAPAGPQNYNTLLHSAMDPLLDAWHLMAYDYAGSWDTTSGHQSNIYPEPQVANATKFSTDRAVTDYLARGVPAHKMVLGLPLYGRAFDDTRGLGLPYTGVGSGSVQAGIWLYKDLPRPGATVFYDKVADASYSFDNATGELVSYDDVESAKVKAAYLKKRGLGGAVFWEASGDRTGNASLVGTLAGSMGKLDASVNLLSYPDSQYENIRAGMPGA